METGNDGAESALFKQLFQKWTVKDQTQGLGKVQTRGKVGMCVFFLNSQKYIKRRIKKVTIASDKKNGLKPYSALAHITQEKFDASLMHMMPEVAAQERMVDNGTGQVEVSAYRLLYQLAHLQT